MTIATSQTAPDQHRHDPRTCKLLPADLYLRLSDARNEKGSFVEREQALREKADRLGWCVVRVVIENDEISGDGTRSKSASAFKRVRVRNADDTFAKHPDGRYVMRVWRPGFRSILGDLTAGRARAVLTEDLDRTMRDPLDAEDLIDVVKHSGSSADSLSGSLRLTAGGTDSEDAMARVMVAMGHKSSRDTARRVSGGRKRKADKSEFGGGRRPYGFGVQRLDSHGDPKVKDDGRPDLDYSAIVPAERDEIRAWAAQVLAGVPLRSVARDLIGRGVPTASGGKWASPTVRDVLLRPRTAGHVVHRSEADRERSRNATDPAEKLPTQYTDKEFVGTLPGEPILADDTWRAVVARLTDPASVVTWTTKDGDKRTAVRGTGVGRAPTYLGTGLYLCHCGQPVSIMAGKQKAARYGCTMTGGGHVSRNVAKVDERVSNVIIQMMSRPAADSVRAVPDDDSDAVDANALRAKVAVLKERRRGLIADEVDGLITRQERDFGLNRLKKKMADIDAVLTANTAVDSGDRLRDAADKAGDDPDKRAAAVRAEWEALPLGLKRRFLADRLVVTILPTRMGSRFDPDSVRIEAANR